MMYIIKYIKSFSKEKPCFAIHKTAFLYKNEACFIPQHGEYIAVVNLETFEIDYLLPVFQKRIKNAIAKLDVAFILVFLLKTSIYAWCRLM